MRTVKTLAEISQRNPIEQHDEFSTAAVEYDFRAEQCGIKVSHSLHLPPITLVSPSLKVGAGRV
jgi:hypothetical protein